MFNANGGYLTEPHQAHLSVACMCRHIHKSNCHLKKKNLFISTPQYQKRLSQFSYKNNIISQRKFVIRKL